MRRLLIFLLSASSVFAQTAPTYVQNWDATNSRLGTIGVTIDGGGAAITTGLKAYFVVPFNCTIQSVTLLANPSGSIVVDVWKTTYAAFDGGATHPVAGDKITASAPPTITSSTKATPAPTGWTLGLSAGDILAFNVTSATTVQRVVVMLKVTKL